MHGAQVLRGVKVLSHEVKRQEKRRPPLAGFPAAVQHERAVAAAGPVRECVLLRRRQKRRGRDRRRALAALGQIGRAAQKIAHKLSEIGKKKQTLCVTHLPQIAAMGNHHMLITKTVRDDRTYTEVRPVAGQARTEEIARMISGDQITKASLANAAELLHDAKTGG